MRVAIATQNYFQANNGQAVFVRRLATGLAGRGHHVLVLAPSDRCTPYHTVGDMLRVEAIRSIHLAPVYSGVFVPLRPRGAVKQRLDAFRPDIVHIQDHYPLCHAVTAEVVARGLPSLGTNHFLPENLIPFVPILSKFSLTRRLMVRVMWRQVLDVFNCLNIVTAPTETAASVLRQQHLLPPVSAISCGVDLMKYFPDPSIDRKACRRRYQLAESDVLLLFIGRIDREKRLDVLLKALAKLDGSGVQLCIAGTGHDLGSLKALAQRLGISDRVHFAGYIDEQDKRALLNSADIFAMPSEAELQSIATLEAMACARPVLAANARALPELVETGCNGFLFRAGDADDAAEGIRTLIAWRSRWPAMGCESLERAREHRVDLTIDRYEELLQRALRREW